MKVQVWNENTYPYTETFKGDRVHIPAKSFVEMDEDDANMFLGTYNAPRKRGDNTPDPAHYKMLRVVRDGATTVSPASAHICNLCAYKASGAKDLDEHSKLHAERTFSDPSLETPVEAKAEKPIRKQAIAKPA